MIGMADNLPQPRGSIPSGRGATPYRPAPGLPACPSLSRSFSDLSCLRCWLWRAGGVSERWRDGRCRDDRLAPAVEASHRAARLSNAVVERLHGLFSPLLLDADQDPLPQHTGYPRRHHRAADEAGDHADMQVPEELRRYLVRAPCPIDVRDLR